MKSNLSIFSFIDVKYHYILRYSNLSIRRTLICSKMLTPWKESYDQLRQHIKSRDITLSTKFCLVKAMVFPVAMYGCERWIIKKAELCRIDAFELWCWRRFLRVSRTSRRSNQSILKEISPGCSLEADAKAETPTLWPPHVKN